MDAYLDEIARYNRGEVQLSRVRDLESFEASLYKEAFISPELKGDIRRAAVNAGISAGAALGVAAVGRGVSSLVDAAMLSTRISKMIEIRPELKHYDRKVVEQTYKTLMSASPDLAKDPLAAGATVLTILQAGVPHDNPRGMPIVNLATLKDLAGLQASRRGSPILESTSKLVGDITARELSTGQAQRHQQAMQTAQTESQQAHQSQMQADKILAERESKRREQTRGLKNSVAVERFKFNNALKAEEAREVEAAERIARRFEAAGLSNVHPEMIRDMRAALPLGEPKHIGDHIMDTNRALRHEVDELGKHKEYLKGENEILTNTANSLLAELHELKRMGKGRNKTSSAPAGAFVKAAAAQILRNAR